MRTIGAPSLLQYATWKVKWIIYVGCRECAWLTTIEMDKWANNAPEGSMVCLAGGSMKPPAEARQNSALADSLDL
eukprot:1704019-Rhodomonas_salina.1